MDKVIDSALLSQAFGLYEEGVAAHYSEEQAFEPSAEFNKKMRKLIKSQTNIYHRVTLTRARRVIFVAAIIVTLLAASMSVDAIRETIFSFFVTGGSQVDVVEYQNESGSSEPAGVESVMKPAYLPEGYTLKDEQKTEDSAYMYYENGGDYLTIEQFTKSGYKSALDAEFKSSTRENYEGLNFIVKTDGDMTALIWERGGYVFEAVGFVSTDELLKTAASVK